MALTDLRELPCFLLLLTNPCCWFSFRGNYLLVASCLLCVCWCFGCVVVVCCRLCVLYCLRGLTTVCWLFVFVVLWVDCRVGCGLFIVLAASSFAAVVRLVGA